MYKPDSVWTWSFVILMVVQAVTIIALEAFCFTVFLSKLTDESYDSSKFAPQPLPGSLPGDKLPRRVVFTRTIPTFFTLYIFGMVYELILVWDALRLKNTIQIIGLCFYNVGLMVYGAVQIDQIQLALKELDGTLDDGSTPASVWLQVGGTMKAIPIVLTAVTIMMCFIAWKLYDEFAWTIYKHISADLRMKRRYLTFQIYIALLKFDFFFFLGFTIQFLVIVQGSPGVSFAKPEFGLTIAAVPITIVILLLAAFWTRREQMMGMIFVVIMYFAALAYFVFKLIRIWSGDKRQNYQPAARPLTSFAAITIILIIATIVTAIQCMTNFNKGLKPHLLTRKVESEEEKHTYVTEMPNLNHGPLPSSRMTIE